MLLILLTTVVSLAAGGPLSSEENAKLQQSCGNTSTETRHPKSLLMNQVTRNDAPFTVMLHLALKDGTPEQRLMQVRDRWTSRDTQCTGTIISSRHILTDANCVTHFGCYRSFNEPFVYFWKTYLLFRPYHFKLNYLVVSAPTFCQRDCDSEFQNLIVKPKRAFFHTNYVNAQCNDVKPETWGDLAVIELEEDIPFTSTVQPACLYSNKIETPVELGVYGYGRTDDMDSRTFGILKKHSAEAIANEECFNATYWTKINVTQSLLETVLGKDRLCAMNTKPMTHIGSSGSGLILKKDQKVYVTATVMQHIFVENNPKESVVFMVQVHPHIDWICAATGVCPRGNLPEEQKADLEKKFYTLEPEDDFVLEDFGQHYDKTH